jgi:hypothetical protein
MMKRRNFIQTVSGGAAAYLAANPLIRFHPGPSIQEHGVEF